jgi:hypothetical protein
MTKEWKLPSPDLLLVILSLLIAFGLTTSCGIVNKNKSSSSSNVDSVTAAIKKQSQKQSSDSANVKKTEKAESKQTENVQSNGLNLKFSTADSQRITGPVIIKRDTAGNLTVDPGGRILESITDTKTHTQKRTSAKTEKVIDSGHVTRQAEKASVDSSGNIYHKDQKAAQSNVQRFQIPWYAYILLPIVLFLIGYVVWKFGLFKKKKQETLVPYSSPNDNTV